MYSVHRLLVEIVGNLVIPAVGLPVGYQSAYSKMSFPAANSQVGNGLQERQLTDLRGSHLYRSHKTLELEPPGWVEGLSLPEHDTDGQNSTCDKSVGGHSLPDQCDKVDPILPNLSAGKRPDATFCHMHVTRVKKKKNSEKNPYRASRVPPPRLSAGGMKRRCKAVRSCE
jgi:hypothetical protein